jgi:mannose-6-phosphate isomerase-like protein (cupin superfamily)
MGALITVAIPARVTGGQFAVIEHVVPPAGGPPPHTHTVTEFLYVLEGIFDVWVDDLDHPVQVEMGAAIVVPPGVPHTTRNADAQAGRLLSLYLPGGDEGFFLDAGIPVADLPEIPDMNAPADMSGMDIGRITALAERYGMQLIPVAPPPRGNRERSY